VGVLLQCRVKYAVPNGEMRCLGLHSKRMLGVSTFKHLRTLPRVVRSLSLQAQLLRANVARPNSEEGEQRHMLCFAYI